MKILNTFLLVLLSSLLYGQVTFTSIPMDSALVARDTTTNLGTIVFSGDVNKTNTPYDSVCLKIYRGGILKDSVYQTLFYIGNLAPFGLSYQIPAELQEYKVEVYGIKQAVQTLDTTINALVAGDVYIIEGQSNAFAMMRDNGSANSNKSEFLRSFASADSSVTGLLSYLKWGMGEGDGGSPEHKHVGQWGMKFGRLLIDSMKIPIAVFNGACGGTPITYYMRPPNYQSSVYSNYGRLYYRLTLTGLANKVRAIMWSQGETDARYGTPTGTYVTEFDTLQKCWLQDFPAVEKTYILQTRNGGMPSYPLLNLQEIKEAQRQVVINDSAHIEIMSTSALRQDTGDLHFDYKGGYEEFGIRMYNLAARDLYRVHPNREIDAPMITKAYMEYPTTLVIEERADSLMRHDPGQPILNFEIENVRAGTIIDTIYLKKNTIILELSKYPGDSLTVSFLAQPKDSGNWVTNTNNIETLCFYKYPVSDTLIIPHNDPTSRVTYDSISNITNGINRYSSVYSFRVYPNPNTGKFSFETNYPLNTNSLAIYNTLGEQVFSSQLNNTITEVDLSNQATGIYIFRVLSKGESVATGKVIIR